MIAQRIFIYFFNFLGDNQDDIKSALQSLMQMLVIRRKRVNVSRVVAFIKRLTTLSLNVLHNGAVSSLATARYIMLVCFYKFYLSQEGYILLDFVYSFVNYHYIFVYLYVNLFISEED